MTLRQWLDAQGGRAAGWTYPRVAEIVGLDRTHIQQLALGRAVPRAGAMLRIFRMTNGEVGPFDWYPEIAREAEAMRQRGRSVRGYSASTSTNRNEARS